MAKFSTVSGKLPLAVPVHFSIFLLAYRCLVLHGKMYVNIWLSWSLVYHLNLTVGESAGESLASEV